MPKLADENALPVDDILINTVIIHPDIIRRLRKLHQDKNIKEEPSFDRFINSTQYIDAVQWANEYGALRVAFICICANHDNTNGNEGATRKAKIRKDYDTLFGGNDTEFEIIYDFWREVRCELIFSDAGVEEPQTPSVGHHVLLKQKGEKSHVVYAAPEPDNSGHA